MVTKVAGQAERESASGDGVAVCDTNAKEGFVVQVAEHEHVALPKTLELTEKRCELAVIVTCTRCIQRLLETWERRGIASRNAEEAVAEDPFGIEDVPDDLSNAPLVRFVPKEERSSDTPESRVLSKAG